MTRLSPPPSVSWRLPRPAGIPSCTRGRTTTCGLAYEAQTDYRQAIDCFGEIVAALDGAWRYERFGQATLPAVVSRANSAGCHAELGMFAEGRALGEEGLRIAEAAAHPASLMIALWGMGLLALRQGDLQRALPRLERAVGICQDADLPSWFPRMAAPLGAAYTLAGRVADALPLLTQAMAQTTATERVDFQARCRLPLGEVQLWLVIWRRRRRSPSGR